MIRSFKGYDSVMLKKTLIFLIVCATIKHHDAHAHTDTPSPKENVKNTQPTQGDFNSIGLNPGQKLPDWNTITWDQAVKLSGDNTTTLNARIQGVYKNSSDQKKEIQKTYPEQIAGFLKFHNGDPTSHNAASYRNEIGRRIVILMTAQGKSPVPKETLVINELSIKTPLESLAKAAGMSVKAAQDIIDTYAQKHGIKDEPTKQKIRKYLNENIQLFEKQRTDTTLEDSMRINATKQVAKSLLNLLSVEKAQVS